MRSPRIRYGIIIQLVLGYWLWAPGLSVLTCSLLFRPFCSFQRYDIFTPYPPFFFFFSFSFFFLFRPVLMQHPTRRLVMALLDLERRELIR